ncbi:MAG TPA: TRAP transporter substrate-binding protein DctP [Pseudogracilibacillus sp.]|nr:TRAP transporter substrate-binding protein DctP [Pseudogracilibacillus sp.]
MKKLILFMVMSFLLIISACGDSNESTSNEGGQKEGTQDPIVLTSSFGATDQHFWYRGFLNVLMDEVEEGSNGEVRFERFTGGELVELGTELEALNSNAIDVALSLQAPYDPQRFPYTEVVMLPTLESDAGIITDAMVNLMQSDIEIKDGKTYNELEFTDKGLVAFPNPSTEAYILSSTKKEFESVADFNQSVRMRTASRIHEILADELNITGQSMSITDSYDALSRGALDGIIYTASDWIAFGFDELIKHSITDVNFGHFVGYMALKQETWDTFSPETQQLFEEKAYELVHEGAAITMEEMEENIASNEEKGGQLKSFNDLDPELQKHLEEVIVLTWEKWIESLEKEGHAGKEIALLWRDLLVDAGAVLPDEILNLE